MLQFDRKNLVIPAGLFRQPIVGNNIGLLVCFSKMREPNAGHGLHIQLPCRQKPAMTGKDLIFIIDQYRVVKPKPFDAAGDLLDLLRRMGARIRRILAGNGRTVFKVHDPGLLGIDGKNSGGNAIVQLDSLIQSRGF